MKNSSRLELTIERNFTLSSRGFSGSCACSSTLFWNSNRLSSRLKYNSGDSRVRVDASEDTSEDTSEDDIVPGVALPEISCGSSEFNSLLAGLCIGAPILLGSIGKMLH